MRDTYGEEMAKKQLVVNKIRDRIGLYGYEEIETPMLEFYDVFSSEVGTTPVKELYKLLDNEGNLLVLRPDFTPAVARCAAKYFSEEESPIRFTYSGSVFGNALSLRGRLCESTQLGAELINAPCVSADAEILALLIDSLLQAGLTQFQISVGNVDYFKGICKEAGGRGGASEKPRLFPQDQGSLPEGDPLCLFQEGAGAFSLRGHASRRPRFDRTADGTG